MRRYALRRLSPEAVLGLLLLSLPGLHVLAVCPAMCSCSRSHREVDCSWRGLRQLPDGLQYNLRSLNLSHNRFQNLDERLTMYTHLRVLDLSHNRLSQLPSGLPRSLWQLLASSNRIQQLGKNDTVYQWNLRKLDLSNNKLERAIFINNTLTNLCSLNLSRNHLWTVPTNLPVHLEAVDLSHNLLLRVLPGSLDRLSRLVHFCLHANRFSMLPTGVLDRLTSLRVITLGTNPWACHLYSDIAYILSWSQHTSAHVLGCPCHTQPTCGGVQAGRTGGGHFASYNPPSLTASSRDVSSPAAPGAGVTEWWHLSVSAPLSTQRQTFTDTPFSLQDHMLHTHLFPPGTYEYSDSYTSSFPDMSVITETPVGGGSGASTLAMDQIFSTAFAQTKRTTTLRTRSVRRPSQSHPRDVGSGSPSSLLHCLLLPLVVVQRVL